MTESQSVKPKAKRAGVKQPWVDAVEFALAECVRFQTLLNEAVRTRELSALPKDDLLYDLRGADGRKFIYGREAEARLVEAAADALRRSDIAQTVSIQRLFKAIKPRIVERFIVKGEEVSLSTVDSLFAAAVNEVRKSRADSRHFIPCQLMFVADPNKFSIGPVTFHNRIAFRPIGEDLVSKHRARAAEEGKVTTAGEVLAYYGRFTWVADVTIKGCDKTIGEERATQAVNAALDFLHLLFGQYHSRKMVVGGPGLDADIRATMEVREGQTLLSYSVGATSAVGFEEGWAEMLNKLGSRQLVAAAGRAIEAITDPATQRPLGLRFIDAASWHGQAVREASPAASVVKSVTALERLVTTEKSTDTMRAVSERTAAMIYNPAGDERFDAVVGRLRDIYDLRSRLAHGTLSPFDPEVRRRRTEVLAAVERALINGLALFDQDGLFDRPLTRKQFTEGLENLIAWSRRIDQEKMAGKSEVSDPSQP